MVEKKNISFNFGQNWEQFSLQALDNAKFKRAEESLNELIGQQNLANKTLVDIGCGSGIFAIAASLLGAKKVIGIDISKESIASSNANKNRFAPEADIEFIHASVFDSNIQQLGKFDIVYSWGVLHHTGDMYKAIDNVCGLCQTGSKIVLAIYNKHWSSRVWCLIKRFYNWAPKPIRILMVWIFFCVIALAKLLVTRKNPFKKKRGMSFYYDVIDWVGGYPYQYASGEEMVKYVQGRGFECIKFVAPVVPTGCNEFVFEKI